MCKKAVKHDRSLKKYRSRIIIRHILSVNVMRNKVISSYQSSKTLSNRNLYKHKPFSKTRQNLNMAQIKSQASYSTVQTKIYQKFVNFLNQLDIFWPAGAGA